MFHADLHIHSRYSRACSRDCDIEHLAWWALRKGITVVGTGDFTHPAWSAELQESLIPAEPGLLRLRPGLEDSLRRTSPRSCAGEVRFMLSAEISTIYRDGDLTRKVHHLLYAPTFEAAGRISGALAKIGNLASDGRPIIGLDSRNLLEITLAGGPGCYLVPAHVWTPWFAVLGSKSGYDLVADCYQDLSDQIFAIETGLSSDPPMNWRCSSLDRYRLVSNSDAHSPPMLGREATTLDCGLDYFAIAAAFRTGQGLAGTIEFFPEEGRYHLDGHRKCGVRLEPGDSDQHDGRCPACGRPLTIGVLHRAGELADRPAGYQRPGAPAFTRLVQLRQVVGEILATGPTSKRVTGEVTRLVGALGAELGILRDVPLSDIGRAGGSDLAEAITRLRQGSVTTAAGYDGEYGTVRLFGPGELGSRATLFDLVPPGLTGALPTAAPSFAAPSPAAAARPGAASPPPAEPAAGPRLSPPADQAAASGHPASYATTGQATTGNPGASLLDQLDADQQAAVLADSPLMIVAGPGTGKTRTLTYRIAYQLSNGLRPGGFLAVTFTRRAADELRARLAALTRPLTGPGDPGAVMVTTFHSLGLRILREQHVRAGLPGDFQVADEAARQEVAAALAGSTRAGHALLRAAAGDSAARETLLAGLTARGLVDLDGLIELPAALLSAEPALAAAYRARWPQVCVDEYQDIDPAQHELLWLLAGDGAGLTVIGDPDQSIYGFRGADVGFFLSFAADFPAAATRQLSRNYRSSTPIAAAAIAAIAPTTLVPGRALRAVAAGPPVTVYQARDEYAEAAWIGITIDQLLGGASFHSIDSGRADSDGQAGLSLGGVAVLYRTDAQSGVIGQALLRSGLPFRKGSHDLLQRRGGVPEILGELRRPGRPGPVAGQVAATAAALAGRVPRQRGVDLLAAGELLAPLARRCGDDLEQFLTEVSLGAAVDALDPRADAITLLTLHAAKGLEFDVVFLAGCEAGLLPLDLAGPRGGAAPGADQAEERRLLFVGMTRARSRLLISYAATRTWHGAPAPAGPSAFLQALGPYLPEPPARPRPQQPAERQLRLL